MPNTQHTEVKPFTLKLTLPATGEVLYDGTGDPHNNAPLQAIMDQYSPFQVNIELDGVPVTYQQILVRLIELEFASMVQTALINQLAEDDPFRFRKTELVN